MKIEDLPEGARFARDNKAIILGSAETPWARDAAATEKLIGLTGHKPVDAETIKAWSDDEVYAVDLWALSSLLDPELGCIVPTLPAVLEAPNPAPAATEATETQPAETKPAKAPNAAKKPPAPPPQPDVATEAQLAILRAAAGNRYGLYLWVKGKEPLGFGVNGPSFDIEGVTACVERGWLVREPSGGAHGAVKIAGPGRDQLDAARAAALA